VNNFQLGRQTNLSDNRPLKPEEIELKKLLKELAIVKEERDILKKALGIFSLAAKSMKFAFMKAHKHLFSVERMSKILGVSKQGFYKFLSRTPSLRERENIRVASSLKVVHLASRMTYGHKRLYHELKAQGYFINKKRVIRLMKTNNIAPKYKKPFRLTTVFLQHWLPHSRKLGPSYRPRKRKSLILRKALIFLDLMYASTLTGNF